MSPLLLAKYPRTTIAPSWLLRGSLTSPGLNPKADRTLTDPAHLPRPAQEYNSIFLIAHGQIIEAKILQLQQDILKSKVLRYTAFSPCLFICYMYTGEARENFYKQKSSHV